MSEDAITLDENRHINNASKYFILYFFLSLVVAMPIHLGAELFNIKKLGRTIVFYDTDFTHLFSIVYMS